MPDHVCPVWVGYLLASPLRRLLQNPFKILSPYVEESMTVLDAGCAMGFFSLPMAKMAGPEGKVICVDIQEKMLDVLRKRAIKAGLSDRIEMRVCSGNSLGLSDLESNVDFAFASAVVHEVPDASAFFSEIHMALKPGARFLVIEPKGHVSEMEFDNTVSCAEKIGFEAVERPKLSRSRSVLLRKQ